MEREEILEMSRRENKNRDFAELDVLFQAGNIAGRVGAGVCCLLSLVSHWIAGVVLYSPWVIYFSILGTHSLAKYARLRRGTDLALAVVYFLLCGLALVLFVLRLAGEKG